MRGGIQARPASNVEGRDEIKDWPTWWWDQMVQLQKKYTFVPLERSTTEYELLKSHLPCPWHPHYRKFTSFEIFLQNLGIVVNFESIIKKNHLGLLFTEFVSYCEVIGPWAV